MALVVGFAGFVAWPLAGQVVRLPLAEFEALRARANLEAEKSPPHPSTFALESAVLDIRVDSLAARIAHRIDLVLLTDRTTSLTLGEIGTLVGARLGDLDGRITSAGEVSDLEARGPGVFRLEIDSVVALEREEGATRATSRLRLGLPAAAVVRGRIAVPAEIDEVELEGGLVERAADGSWNFVARGGDPVLFTLRARRQDTNRVALPPRYSATSSTLASLGRTRLRAESWIEIRVAQGELAAVELELPPGFEVVRVPGPVAGWKRDGDLLSITPLEPVTSSLSLSLALAAPARVELASPLVLPRGADRVELFSRLTLSADGLLELTDAGDSRVASTAEAARLPATLRAGSGRLLAVRDATHAPQWRAEWAEGASMLAAQVERLVVEITVGEAGRAGCRLWFEVRNRGQERLAVTLPAGFEWVGATRDEQPLVPGRGAAGTLELPLVADDDLQLFVLTGHLPLALADGQTDLVLPIPSFSAPVARVEVRALLPGGRTYTLLEPGRAGPAAPPPGALRAQLVKSSYASNTIARQMRSVTTEVDAGAASYLPLPPGQVEVTAAWSALSASPTPLALRIRPVKEVAPWF